MGISLSLADAREHRIHLDVQPASEVEVHILPNDSSPCRAVVLALLSILVQMLTLLDFVVAQVRSILDQWLGVVRGNAFRRCDDIQLSVGRIEQCQLVGSLEGDMVDSGVARCRGRNEWT